MSIFELFELVFFPDVVIERWVERARWAGVPDGAISRALPPSTDPQPTARSLSVADSPKEDQSRLTTSVEESTTEEAVVVVVKA